MSFIDGTSVRAGTLGGCVADRTGVDEASSTGLVSVGSLDARKSRTEVASMRFIEVTSVHVVRS